jgi:hypothetical protein
VASNRPSPRRRLLARLAALAPVEVDEALAATLQAEFPEIRPRGFRQALRSSGVKLAPLVEGVRQESLAAVERTLTTLAGEYEAADSPRRKAIRRMVIESRVHAEFALRNPKLNERRRPDKEETLLWILTWLRNPPVFAGWLDLRQRTSR